MPSEPLAYLNGRMLPASEATLSLDDLGFVQGVTIVDRLRTFRKELFRLDDHLRRFRQSCELAFVPQPRSHAELAATACELIEANVVRLPDVREWSLVIFATPGAGDPTLGMQAMPMNFERYRRLFTQGANLISLAVAQPNGLSPKIKHRSRLAWWIAQRTVNASMNLYRNAEVLLTTNCPVPCIRETPIANILVELEGKLISPPRSEILNGVSLQVTEELCGSLGIPFAEREITLEEGLTQGGEWMLTNTSFCVAPVSRVADEEKPLNGPIFRRLIESWNDLVGLDIQAQFFELSP